MPSWGVFWLNIAKFEVNWYYRYYFNLFSNLRKENELWQYHYRNSTKVRERKIRSRREKFFIFSNGMAAIPSAHTCCPSGCSKCECVQGKPNDVDKKKFGNCGNAITEIGKEKKIVVAKIWGGIKKISVTSTIFLQHFHNKSHVISYY